MSPRPQTDCAFTWDRWGRGARVWPRVSSYIASLKQRSEHEHFFPGGGERIDSLCGCSFAVQSVVIMKVLHVFPSVSMCGTSIAALQQYFIIPTTCMTYNSLLHIQALCTWGKCANSDGQQGAPLYLLHTQPPKYISTWQHGQPISFYYTPSGRVIVSRVPNKRSLWARTAQRGFVWCCFRIYRRQYRQTK